MKSIMVDFRYSICICMSMNTRLNARLVSTILFVVCLLSTVQAGAAEKIIGLVQVPSIVDTSYPDGPPEGKMSAHFEPVKVYSRPDAQSAIVQELHRQNQVATHEYAYERNAAIVYEKKDGWYRIALTNSGLKVGGQAASGWLNVKAVGTFFSLEDLLKKSPYLTTEWNNFLYKLPDEQGGRHPFGSAFSEHGTQSKADVNVLGTKSVEGVLWAEVQVLGNGRCMGLKPQEADRGWVPVYNSSNEPNVWYNPRGCPGH